LLVRKMWRDTITIKGTAGSLMIPPFFGFLFITKGHYGVINFNCIN
jgi:hypothetical protein